ncbi:acyl-CoA dehydrogenase family protein [Corynebacterium terpenotabidum]|uniref:Acyl-CoA dehydrogenase FadE n=1 Tax=Corynebacterium terpenotabidum Y-11 TaxID=1200352 RepID=S4XL46_9CORY|nr:acyl-CoA dehydrogenase family protein [Corynebacterium terpenotabidum]AGP31318.1 acyl-CoA dehydrogenase FadE [Corynebacterium terpenotabidum Y-11]
MTYQDWTSFEITSLHDLATDFTRTEILPHQDQWEAEGLIPRSLSQAAANLGLLGIDFPEKVGGGGAGFREFATIIEAMHEAGAAAGIEPALFTVAISCPHLIAAGGDDLVDRYVRPALAGEKIGSLAITEPGGGSDVGHLKTTARRDGDEYVINGSKTFITSAVRGDFTVVAARTGGPDQPGARGVSLIVVDNDTPGFTVTRKLAKMGWRCSDTAELAFTDVRVPVSNLIGEENTGFQLISLGFVTERLTLAVQAYSQAQRCLDLSVQWCRDRETFGAPLISRQHIQMQLAEMARRIDVARVYTRAIIDRWDDGETDLVTEACFAKNTCTEVGEWVTDTAVQLFGGAGFMDGTEVERQYRDMRVNGIGGGTVEILRELSARRLGYTA